MQPAYCPHEYPFAMPSPVWTPDGLGFAYLNPDRPENIWVQAIDGRPARRLTNFSDRQIASFAWSPDGKRLAITAHSF